MEFQIERMSLHAAAEVLAQVDSGDLVQRLHADGTSRTQLDQSSEMVAIDRSVFLKVTLTT